KPSDEMDEISEMDEVSEIVKVDQKCRNYRGYCVTHGIRSKVGLTEEAYLKTGVPHGTASSNLAPSANPGAGSRDRSILQSKLQEINHGKMAAAVFNRLLCHRLDFALRFADLFCRSSSRNDQL